MKTAKEFYCITGSLSSGATSFQGDEALVKPGLHVTRWLSIWAGFCVGEDGDGLNGQTACREALPVCMCKAVFVFAFGREPVKHAAFQFTAPSPERSCVGVGHRDGSLAQRSLVFPACVSSSDLH